MCVCVSVTSCSSVAAQLQLSCSSSSRRHKLASATVSNGRSALQQQYLTHAMLPGDLSCSSVAAKLQQQ